jgi:hypothetical protein
MQRETPTGSTHKEFSRGAQPSPNYFSALVGMSASARAKQSACLPLLKILTPLSLRAAAYVRVWVTQ